MAAEVELEIRSKHLKKDIVNTAFDVSLTDVMI